VVVVNISVEVAGYSVDMLEALMGYLMVVKMD
jgi:hypothetical protein